jgi:hypothetical protein
MLARNFNFGSCGLEPILPVTQKKLHQLSGKAAYRPQNHPATQ